MSSSPTAEWRRSEIITETRSVSASGFSFDVDVAGPSNGAPVLMLHGFPETRAMWSSPLAALASAGFRLVAPDQRGYSPGARPTRLEDYATSSLLDDALGIMEALGARRFHVVGHDWGGQVAWLLAALHPQRIASLFVISRPHPAAFAQAIKQDPTQAARSEHQRAFFEDGAAQRLRESGLESLRSAMQAGGVPDAHVALYTRAMLAPGGIEAAMDWYRANSLPDATVPPIDVPTTYVWGTEDATVGKMAAGLTRQYVRGTYAFNVVDGGSHFLVDQRPEDVSALLLTHLRKCN